MNLVSTTPRADTGRLASDPLRLSDVEQATTLAYRPRRRCAEGWYRLEVRYPTAGVVEHMIELRLACGSRTFHRLDVPARNHFDGGIRVGGELQTLLLHVSGSGVSSAPPFLLLTRWPQGRVLGNQVARIWSLMRSRPGAVLPLLGRIVKRPLQSPGIACDPYARWRERFDDRPERDLALHLERSRRLGRPVVISVLAVCHGGAGGLDRVLRQMAAQIYQGWQLVLSGRVEAGQVAAAVHRHRLDAARIDLCPGADTPAAALNAALPKAKGGLVMDLREDIELRPHALLECALALSHFQEAKLIYADHDHLTPDGRREAPCFKPALSPERLRAHDYIESPAWFDTATVKALGGWRAEPAGCESHDLKLRLVAAIGALQAVHIPKILCHRLQQGRGRTPATLRDKPGPAAVASALASIIIPTRDRFDLLQRCIASIRETTADADREIIIVDHESTDPKTLAYLATLSDAVGFTVIRRTGTFNHSALCNSAATLAKGAFLVLLNNDVEAISPDWLGRMVRMAGSAGVGCVGAKLLYPDRTIQHGGVVLGLFDGAGHVHRRAAAPDPGYLDRLVVDQEVSAVTGACLVVRKTVFDEVGSLDEASFEGAHNDVDLCLRVAAAGFRNVWTPSAVLMHHESATRGPDAGPDKVAVAQAALDRMHARWGSRMVCDPYYSPHLTHRSESGSIRTG